MFTFFVYIFCLYFLFIFFIDNLFTFTHSRSIGPPLYPHNTYHGYNHHQRTPLAQANFKPLKFTDSPIMNYNSTGHNSIVEGENVSQDDEVCM